MHQPPAQEQPANPAPAEHVEDALDEALAESFPASDPVAISSSEPAARAPKS